MAEPRILYEDGRPDTVPDSLAELTGPTSGVVELPLHLDWSEQGRYSRSDPTRSPGRPEPAWIRSTSG